MGWLGFVGAGLGFIGLGMWRSSGGKSRDVENFGVIGLSLIHILASLVVFHQDAKTGNIVSSAVALERSGVASMFLVYGIAAILRQKSTLFPFPREALNFLAAGGFALEFLVFYLRNSDGIEGQYYRLFLVPIGVCLLTTSLQIGNPTNELLHLFQNFGIILQGSWLIQMAVSLFTKFGMAQGCDLDEKGGGDFSVICKGMKSMRGRAMATLQFNLQLAILLLLVLPVYVIMNREKNRIQVAGKYEHLVDDSSGLQLSQRGSNGSHPVYVLEDDESN